MTKEQRRLVHGEYIDARFMYAAYHSFKRMEKHKDRWHLTQDGWKFYRLGMAFFNKAINEFESTFTEEDKRKLKRDLNSSEIYLHTAAVATLRVDDSDMIFITRNEMSDILRYAMEDCKFCDKTGKDALKCKKRKAIHKTFVHEVPALVEDGCIWSDYAIRTEDERQKMIDWTWADADKEREMEGE